MTDLRKAAEMALEVLLDPKTRADEVAEAVKVIRQALAQPEHEPVAWMTHSNDLQPLFHKTRASALNWKTQPTPLYTAPPKREWVGLTDEEVGTLTVFDGLHHVETPLLADFIRAIEAKLKEKNGG